MLRPIVGVTGMFVLIPKDASMMQSLRHLSVFFWPCKLRKWHLSDFCSFLCLPGPFSRADAVWRVSALRWEGWSYLKLRCFMHWWWNCPLGGTMPKIYVNSLVSCPNKNPKIVRWVAPFMGYTVLTMLDVIQQVFKCLGWHQLQLGGIHTTRTP